MPLTMYEVSVPMFRQMLSALSSVLDKAAAYAAEKKIEPSVLLQARLFADMLPLTSQVQIATDHAKGATARLSGGEPPKFADAEKTVEELKARIAKTLDYIGSVAAAKMDGAEDRQISLKIGGLQLDFTGRQYLLGFALPNFFFHVTTAYDILRHQGVPIGKRDFVGQIR
jgi:hypothetical protein